MRLLFLLSNLFFFSLTCFSQTEDLPKNNSLIFRIDYQDGSSNEHRVDSINTFYISKLNRYFPLLRIGFHKNIKKNRFFRFGAKASVINIFDDFEVLVNSGSTAGVFPTRVFASTDEEDQFNTTNIKVGLFAEYGIPLMNEGNFSIYLGIEAGLDYDQFRANPIDSKYFELRLLNINAIANTHPIIRFDISDKVALEFCYSFRIISFGADYQYTGNPSLTELQRKSGGFNFDMLRFRDNNAGLTIKYRL